MPGDVDTVNDERNQSARQGSGTTQAGHNASLLSTEHPNTCLIEGKGIRVEDGHTWDLPDCMQAQCSGFGEDMFIDYYT